MQRLQRIGGNRQVRFSSIILSIPRLLGLGIQFKKVGSNKPFVYFFPFIWQIFPASNFTATYLRATHALFGEIINTVISHSIIEGYLIIGFNISHGNKVMGSGFIYADAAIRVTGMIYLTY